MAIIINAKLVGYRTRLLDYTSFKSYHVSFTFMRYDSSFREYDGNVFFTRITLKKPYSVPAIVVEHCGFVTSGPKSNTAVGKVLHRRKKVTQPGGGGFECPSLHFHLMIFEIFIVVGDI